MHFIIVGQQRFALPVGETRIGGSGTGALPFPELASLAAVATIHCPPEGPPRLLPVRRSPVGVTVDGIRVGPVPVTLSHGMTIELAGLRLVFAELRELRTATEIMSVRAERSAVGGDGGSANPRSRGHLVARGTGVIAEIPNSALVIGRAPDSDLVIPTRDVSRRHAVIKFARESYVIRDVSANGTFVNGERINGWRVLRMGDIIRIGSEELRFEVDAALAADAGGAAEASAAGAFEHALIVEPPTRPRTH